MGEAIIAALLRRKVVVPEEITVSDIAPLRLDYLYEKYGVNITGNNSTAINDTEIIVLAIKPQILPDIMAELKGKFKATQVILSIIAGTGIQKLRKGLGHRRIVRSMPNTPAQIGEGITVWTTTPEVTKIQKGTARTILRVMGHEVEVDDEKYLDMATAVSGSGPAYVFYFIESMISAAQKLGFSEDTARTLVNQTVIGSVHLMQKSNKTPIEMRKAVTSPGGTTAAAIAQLEKEDFPGLLARAVMAAHNRAVQLGR